MIIKNELITVVSLFRCNQKKEGVRHDRAAEHHSSGICDLCHRIYRTKSMGFETQTLSKMALYLMSPFLVFRTFYDTTFTTTYGYMLIYTLILCFTLIGFVYVISYFKNTACVKRAD